MKFSLRTLMFVMLLSSPAIAFGWQLAPFILLQFDIVPQGWERVHSGCHTRPWVSYDEALKSAENMQHQGSDDAMLSPGTEPEFDTPLN